MTKLTAVTLAIAALGGASAGPGAQPAAAAGSPKAAGLKAFASCKSLLRYARRNTLRRLEPALHGPVSGPLRRAEPIRVQREGFTPPAAAPGSQEFSQTNVQEPGVDEPDIVKTDGTHIFAVAAGKLHAIDVSGPAPRRVGTLRLGSAAADHDLILHGGRLLVISRGEAGQTRAARAASLVRTGTAQTVLSEVDVSTPSSMRLARTLTVEGSHVSARLSGGTARVVISTPAPALDLPAPAAGGAEAFRRARRRSRAALRRARLGRWMPSYVLRDRRTRRSVKRRLVRCRAVRRATTFSGLGLLSVITIDLDKGLPPVDSDALMTDADIVYGSGRSLYLATPRWMDEDLSAERQGRGMTTQIHRFDASARDSTSYRASGRVRGFLLNQFSLSEHAEHLRVASTSEPVWSEGGRDGDSESFVTVLAERDGRLVTVGRVGGLGRGEVIHSVRFIGEVGYVVTFREVDPLYTLDLSRPQAPRVMGELKIRGYSAYLHPAGGDLLIGVGQDATRAGRALGTQISLFDVSDLRAPRRLHRHTIAAATSEVELDHHAFLWWAPAGLALLPVEVDPAGPASGPAFTGAIGLRIGRDTGIVEAARIVHGSGGSLQPVRRSIVVSGRLYTISGGGIAANDIATFDRLAFIALR